MKVPRSAVSFTEVIDVSSESAIDVPVMARATSSLTAAGVPIVLTGLSLTAAKSIVFTYAAEL